MCATSWPRLNRRGRFIWLSSRYLRSAGDFFAGTVLLSDPDGVLQSFPATKD